MFFALSKITFFLLQPVNWVFFLLLFAAFRRKRRIGRRAFRLGMGLLFLITNPLLTNFALRLWEYPPVALPMQEQPYELGIVLGGYVAYGINAPTDRLQVNHYGNRLVNAAELLATKRVQKLLLSGGSGVLVGPITDEAKATEQWLTQMGFPDSTLLFERSSRNTLENIRNSIAIIDQHYERRPRILLITSAFHMRRALAICQKQGLVAEPFPTDVQQQKLHPAPRFWLIPDAKAPAIWELLIKEWVGMLVYKLRGYA